MKRVEKQQREYDVIVEKRCDVCGMDLLNLESWDAMEVVCKCTTGERHTEDYGDIATIEADLCAKCFVDVVVTALESRGVVLRKTKVSW